MTPDTHLPVLGPAARAWSVPRAIPGQTVAILGSGPSLTASQADRVKRFWTIAISDACTLAPWADLVYSCDARWWDHHQPTARGLKVGLAPAPAWPNTRTLRPDADAVLSDDPAALATGKGGALNEFASSGYQAINLACLLGAHRILLLGYDLRVVEGRHHFFGDHPLAFGQADHYAQMRESFSKLQRALDGRGVRVINCTPGSALSCFPHVELEKALV